MLHAFNAFVILDLQTPHRNARIYLLPKTTKYNVFTFNALSNVTKKKITYKM